MEKYTCNKNCGNTQPRKGSIAICSRGFLGLITDDDKKDIIYSDGNVGKAYVGIHLCTDMKFFGTGWSSTKPKVIGHINDFL